MAKYNNWKRNKAAPPMVDYGNVRRDPIVIDRLYPLDTKTDDILCERMSRLPEEKQMKANFKLAYNNIIRSSV